MRTFLLILLGCCSLLAADRHDFALQPPAHTVTIDCDLYHLVFDLDKHMAREITFTVQAAEIGRGIERPRNWYALPDLPETLDDPDYTGSGYDRSHLRGLMLSSASPHWEQVNALHQIVPMTRDLNRGPWWLMEQRVEQLARDSGSCSVQIICEFARPPNALPPLPQSDEPYEIPSSFLVTLNGRQRYRFPNATGLTKDLVCYLIP